MKITKGRGNEKAFALSRWDWLLNKKEVLPKALHNKQSYFAQLDSVRAVAVIFVLLSHWISTRWFLTGVQRYIFGSFGVDCFFVLSGFLITGILLESKQEANEGTITKKYALLRFYFRRSLRIFPIYYLLLFLMALLSLRTNMVVKEELFYAGSYTTNFLSHHTREWRPLTGHFWSLSVEEQFYLFWPFLILFIKKKWLFPVIIFSVLTGIVYGFIDLDLEFGYITTITCLSALGAGGLFALARVQYASYLEAAYRVVSFMALVCLLFVLKEFFTGKMYVFPHRNFYTPMALFIIMSIVMGKTRKNANPFKYILDLKPLQFIGRISYGVYLYHFAVTYLVDFVAQKIFHKSYLLWRIETENIYFLLAGFCSVIFISWLSFRYIESPLLRLKDRMGKPVRPANLSVLHEVY